MRECLYPCQCWSPYTPQGRLRGAVDAPDRQADTVPLETLIGLPDPRAIRARRKELRCASSTRCHQLSSAVARPCVGRGCRRNRKRHPHGLAVSAPGDAGVTCLRAPSRSWMPTRCLDRTASVGHVSASLDKATVLVNRINMFWGTKWSAEPSFFNERTLRRSHDDAVAYRLRRHPHGGSSGSDSPHPANDLLA